MTWNNTTLLLISTFLLTTINGHDTLQIKTDTLKTDTQYIQYEMDSIRVQQTEMNVELKRQLNFLRNILDSEEKKRQDTISPQ